MLVSVLSVSGAPGVTTLCLALGTTWPTVRADGVQATARRSAGLLVGGSPADSRPAGSSSVLVAECDPDGGVLAARFGLADRRGWGGLCADVRRQGSAEVDAFVDVLPGGLHVLVGCRSGERGALRGPVRAHAFDVLVAEARERDVIVDLGRFDPELEADDLVLRRSDRVVVLVQPDVGSVVRLCDHADRLRSSAGDAVGVALRGRGPYSRGAIARAAGLRVVGTVPDAPASAGALGGELPPARRLRRSRFLHAAASLADELAGDAARPGSNGDGDGPRDGRGVLPRHHGRDGATAPPTGIGRGT